MTGWRVSVTVFLFMCADKNGVACLCLGFVCCVVVLVILCLSVLLSLWAVVLGVFGRCGVWFVGWGRVGGFVLIAGCLVRSLGF